VAFNNPTGAPKQAQNRPDARTALDYCAGRHKNSSIIRHIEIPVRELSHRVFESSKFKDSLSQGSGPVLSATNLQEADHGSAVA
jgi:hypothetical protein